MGARTNLRWACLALVLVAPAALPQNCTNEGSTWNPSNVSISSGTSCYAAGAITINSQFLVNGATPATANVTILGASPITLQAGFDAKAPQSGVGFLATIAVPVTVTSAPSGLSLTVDGTAYTAPCYFQWTPGSQHTIAASSQTAPGAQYAYSSWSDNGAASHTVAPSAETTYTANFSAQYQLTTDTSPPGGGSITSPASGTWYNGGQQATLTEAPTTGYTFSDYTNSGGSLSGNVVTMTGPVTITAHFTQGSASALTLPSPLKGVEYFPRGHAWWNLFYDYYTLDCSTSTVPQSCASGAYVYQIVQNDMATLAANGFNLIHLYLWDQDIAVDSRPNNIPGSCTPPPQSGSPQPQPQGCTYPGFAGWDDGGPQFPANHQPPLNYNPTGSQYNQWNALQGVVAAAKAKNIWVALHFAVGRASLEMANGAPSGPCAGITAFTNALGSCLGGLYANWINAFIYTLAPYQNVLIWGINYGLQQPQNSQYDPYTPFWQAAYPSILTELQLNPYASPSGRALIMPESGFDGIWPANPNNPNPNNQDVQPILSLQPWPYGGNYIGYQWNCQSVATTASQWQETLGLQPDLWAFQMYNASAADLEGALGCVAQAIPFSQMVVTEVATGSSFESPPIGNGLANVFDSQVPTTSAAGQAQWLTDTYCVFARHPAIPAYGWYGLYDSASWWEANYSSYTGAALSSVGYWGLSSEVSSYGNKPAWNAMLSFPSNCPSATLPPAPVLALYADAPYYTQADIGIINYTAANVSSLSLSEPPLNSNGIFSCETPDQIKSNTSPLVGSCASLYVTMQTTTNQITLSGSNADVAGSQSGYQTNGSASTNVTVGPNPIVGGIQEYNTGQTCNLSQNPGCVITASQDDTIVIYGEGFSLTGGNTIHLTGPGNVWLYETDGYYYWDDSRTQINAQIACYVTPGTWSFNVLNPKNGNPSASYSIQVVSSPSCS